MYENLLDAPCYELRGRPDATIFISALFDLFNQDCTLVLEGSGQAPAIQSILTTISEHVRTSEQIWNGLSYEIRLGCAVPLQLVELCESHAAPEYCDHCFVFRGQVPILLWFDFGDDQIVVRPEVDETIVRALVERTGIAYVKREV